MARTLTVLVLLILISLGTGCLEQKLTTPIVEEAGDTKTQPEVKATLPPNEKTPEKKVEIKFEVNSPKDYAQVLNEKYATCLECHGDVKKFHTVEILYLLDREKGVTPRLCIVCHGQKVHVIHGELLNLNSIKCETCHSVGGSFTKPEAQEGQLLVCEVCHSGGNYIKIHIEGNILEGAPIDEEWMKSRVGHQCDTCHIGEFDVIHFEPLSNWSEKIDSATEKSNREVFHPLNISYL
jgi:hypothetical protein